jgi:hypothetical protein
MNDKIVVLSSLIQGDLEAIAKIYTTLERHPLPPDGNEGQLIVIAYYVHNLYNAFENIFQNIATTFENSVEESGRWHAQLLERMRLDVTPLRPAVIDEAAYDALDELRRFRHLFRHAYRAQLDPLRLEFVLRKALALKAIYRGQVEQFLAFLQRLSE